ncbi:MAG: hypothetical protein J5I47_13415 [Vicingus serpentipes]|nr:hypothetical protein [Vicingus serpentipes]
MANNLPKINLTPKLYLHEYIPESLYVKYAKSKPHYLIGLLDKKLITVDQFMRERYGKVTINNWYYGGNRNWSGIRTPDSPYYSQFSQHSYGRASDKIFKEITAEEVRADIKNNYVSLYKELGLSCIEDNVDWLHSDVRFHNFSGYNNTGLLIVKP